MDIRVGGLADVPAMAALHVRSRQYAYRHMIPAEQLDAIDLAEATRKWTDRYLADEPNYRLLLAYQDDRLIGFSYFGRSADDEGFGELNALHVDPDFHGTGAGRELMVATRAMLTELGYDKLVLWVLDGNDRARRFYERDGWVHDGTTKQEEIAGAMTTILRYVRSGEHPTDAL